MVEIVYRTVVCIVGSDGGISHIAGEKNTGVRVYNKTIRGHICLSDTSTDGDKSEMCNNVLCPRVCDGEKWMGGIS